MGAVLVDTSMPNLYEVGRNEVGYSLEEIKNTLIELSGVEAGTIVFNLGQDITEEKRWGWYKDIIIAERNRSSASLKKHIEYRIEPVDVRTFVEDPYYLNKKYDIYPVVLEALIEINNGQYEEALLTGGIGCYPSDAEFLTPTGWKAIASYKKDDLVAQYDPTTGASSFVPPTEYIDLPSDGWYNWKNKRSFEMQVSPEHRVLWYTYYKSHHYVTKAEDLAKRHWELKEGVSGSVPSCFIGGSEGIQLSDDELRLMIAFLADGNIHPFVKQKGENAGKHRCRITVRKLRKRERLEQLLLRCGIPFTCGSSKNRPTEFTYWFYPPVETKSYAFLWQASQAQLQIIVSELQHWDGLFSKEELRFHTTDKEAADFVQYAWVATNHESYIGVRTSESRGGRKALYIVQANNLIAKGHSLRNTICEYVPPLEGERKYCFTVPTGFLVIRYHNKVFISGNSAKSTLALYTQLYQLYLLSCMKNPHKSFGLDPSSEIVIAFQSINFTVAKQGDYGRFMHMVAGCQYFQEHFPIDKKIESRLVFPNRIEVIPVSGLETALIGKNIFSIILEEVNFMAVTEKSKKGIDGGAFDQAIKLYNSISKRRESRFMSGGKLPGVLCIVSSKRYPGQFTDTKEAEAKKQIAETGRSKIYVYDKRVFDIKPDAFGKERFQIFIGDSARKPRILEPFEHVDPADRHLVDHIPLEFKHDFERDIVTSLRDIAGHSTLASHPFIMNTESITQCMDRTNSIFSVDSVDFVSDQLFLHPDNFYKPELPRYAHIDLGITGDSAGLTIGTITGFEKMIRGEGEDKIAEILPKYYVDGSLEVRPPKGGEILFWKIRNVLYKLRDLGLNIKWVSLDSFQSRDTLQTLRQKGFFTGMLSLDTSSLPYEVTKAALYDNRISMPYHAKLQKELAALEFDPAKSKVDHPSTANASKDVADSLGGMTYGLLSRREIWANFGISPMEIPESVKQGSDKQKAPDLPTSNVATGFNEAEVEAYRAMRKRN